MTSDRYAIQLTRDAEKDLKRLRSQLGDVTRALSRLASDPFAGHALTGSLTRARALEFTLKGSGAYRAVYTILDDESVCVVFIVGPHENIYKKAERRYEALKRSGDL